MMGSPPSANIFIIMEVPERGSPETTMMSFEAAGEWRENSFFSTG